MTFSKLPLCLGVLALSGVATASHFATRVVSFSQLGVGIYGDPQAALGMPAPWVRDTSPNGGPDQRIRTSLIYGAWNVTPEGTPAVVTIRAGGHLTLEFQPPIQDRAGNWFGLDFIVFGNAFLASNQPMTWQTQPLLTNILAAPDFVEPMQVSVSPDGIRWYSYPVSNTSGADGYWPTQAFRWNAQAGDWGAMSDFTKPVSPSLTRSQLSGQTLARAIELFDGSGGGTAFDLRPSGFRWVRYIRIDGNGGEVDAVARVSRALVPASLVSTQP